MSTSQKGEVSLEFIVLVGLILVFFVSMVAVIGMKNQDITESATYSDAQKIADTVAAEINTASRIEGYYREFEIPQRIAGMENYTVIINRNFRMVEVLWGEKNKMSSIMTENVTGEARPGKNLIRNSGGMITIES
jgi:uncharacterized protein (UPF0333 family)